VVILEKNPSSSLIKALSILCKNNRGKKTDDLSVDPSFIGFLADSW